LQTLRIVAPLSRRKSAIVLKLGASCQVTGQPDQLKVASRLGLKAAAGLRPVQLAVDVDVEQGRRGVPWPACGGQIGAPKDQLAQVQFVDEDSDDEDGAGCMDPVIEPLWEENALRSVLAFDVSPHPSLPSV
jgi:hypothetical protein